MSETSWKIPKSTFKKFGLFYKVEYERELKKFIVLSSENFSTSFRKKEFYWSRISESAPKAYVISA